MAKRQVIPAPAAKDALQMLGHQVRIRRHERQWSARGLAQRVGVSEKTVLAIEQGSPGVAIGTAFNVADKVGLALFEMEAADRRFARRLSADALRLLPRNVREPAKDEDAHLYDF